MIKNLIKKTLFKIKFLLTVIKYYCSPNIKPYALKLYEDSLPSAPVENISAWSLYEKEEIINSYNHFKKYFHSSIFLFYKEEILEYAIKKSLKNKDNINKLNLEFGVWKGDSINFISKFIFNNSIYGFDSFEGLNHDWKGYYLPSGTFNLNKKIPKMNKNVVPVIGLIEDTLPKFLEEKNKKINFVHIDTDIYESALIILKNIKRYLSKDCIIVFDEIYNFPGWSVGEYKALSEVFNEREYKFLAFAKNGQQAVIQII